MDKNLNSRGARGGALSFGNRKLSRTRLLIIASLLMLCLTSLQSTASAQNCFQQCQQEYVACQRAGLGLICDDIYDGCIQSCIGASRSAAFSINRLGNEKSRLFLLPPAGRFTGTASSIRVWDSFGMLWLVKDFTIDGKPSHQSCFD